jgi:hypothetical protein
VDPSTGGEDEGEATTGEETPSEAPAVFDGMAATTGNTDPATRWLIPGIGVVPGTVTSLWIMNSSADQATVTITPLGAAAGGPEKIIMAPGSLAEIPFAEVTETGMSGVIIDATVPVSAALSIAGSQGVAFVGGIPVE